MPKTYRITLKGHDHTTMFSGTIHVEEIIELRSAAVHPVQGTSTPAPPAGSSRRDTDPRMTEPQRRYSDFIFSPARWRQGRSLRARSRRRCR
jgi:hypothetical protein